MQLGNAEADRRTGVVVYLYLFDVVHVDGHDVTRFRLRQRKTVLRRLLAFRDPLCCGQLLVNSVVGCLHPFGSAEPTEY